MTTEKATRANLRVEREAREFRGVYYITDVLPKAI